MVKWHHHIISSNRIRLWQKISRLHGVQNDRWKPCSADQIHILRQDVVNREYEMSEELILPKSLRYMYKCGWNRYGVAFCKV